jgi:hypothetical protein
VGGRKHTLEPYDEPVNVARPGERKVRDGPQFILLEIVADPLDTVCENSHISLAGLVPPSRNIPGQLRRRFLPDTASAQITLHFYNGRTDLDVDASPIPHRRFKANYLRLFKLERCGQYELTYVRLNIGLGAVRAALRKPINYFEQ